MDMYIHCNLSLIFLIFFKIEQIIAHIKAQADAYVNARFYISNSNNQYLLFFAVSIYEDMIKSGKWDALNIAEQTDLRNLLFDFLLAKYKVFSLEHCILELSLTNLCSRSHLTYAIKLPK